MAAKVAKVEGGTRQRYITLKKFYRFAEDLHLNTHTERETLGFRGRQWIQGSQGAFCSTALGAEFPVCSRARICHILSLISCRLKFVCRIRFVCLFVSPVLGSLQTNLSFKLDLFFRGTDKKCILSMKNKITCGLFLIKACLPVLETKFY